MTRNNNRPVLHIKKYPNRRYYDATRSRHVTLQEVYDLVQDGSDVTISDSRTGEDITNLVLLQLVLEKEQPKLDVFPSSILYQMIRSNRHVLRTTVERFFGPFMNVFATSQKQFEAHLRQVMTGSLVTPMDWANSMLDAFSPRTREPAADGRDGHPPEPDEEPPQSDPRVDELREQVAALTRRMEDLADATPRRPDAQQEKPTG